MLEASGGYERAICDALAALQTDHELSRMQDVMRELKGVGPQTVLTLLAHLSEFGLLDRQKVAAFAGLAAPHPQQSGSWKGNRRIYGGRASVRRARFMAVRSAAQWSP